MKTPIDLLKDYVIAPIHRLHRDYLGANARHNKIYKPIANFVFDKSKEMPVIMLALNAVSVISSHLAQIGGLRRSKRENKDYLIKQERTELLLDIGLTIIPPFVVNNYLTKKLDSGVWTTKSARNNLRYVIAPTVGAQQKELYNVDHLLGTKDTIKNAVNSILLSLKKANKLPRFLVEKLDIKEPDLNVRVPMPKMDKITTDFDVIRKRKFKGFYNGSAYDEIVGQRNGILMMAAIAYTVVASNIVIPILKNKIANYSYKKQLEKAGETPESIKRKKRYNSLAQTAEISNAENVFNVFSNSNNTVTLKEVPDRSLYMNLLREPVNDKNIFNDLYFKGISSQSTGLRI